MKVYDELVERYGERPEAGLAEQVVKALLQQGRDPWCPGPFGGGRLAVYDELVERYGERPEA